MLRNLLLGDTSKARKFQQNIVSYNNAFAMASRRFNMEAVPGRGIGPAVAGVGIPVAKVRGTTWHHLSTVFHSTNQPPKFGNFFAYAADEAHEKRMENDIISKNCDPAVTLKY